MNNLTQKQEEFAQEYVRTNDLSAAFRFAYKTKATPKSINEQASRLLLNLKIKARVEELHVIAGEIANRKFSITAEDMLWHLNILKNARIDEYVNLTTEKIEVGYDDEKDEPVFTEKLICIWKPFSELTKEQLMCIESLKETRYGIELKLHGKEWTIEKINKHIGFYEKDNAQSKTEVVVSNNLDLSKLSTDTLSDIAGAYEPKE